jgi:hypothetical protein
VVLFARTEVDMARFVLLEHDYPVLHWDLMLEVGNALWTWRLPAPPSKDIPFDALRLADHRLHYLDYEGPVSGNRGQVRRWDAGLMIWKVQGERQVILGLDGERLRGEIQLEWLSEDRWTGRFEPADSA